jgi:hypothetical protein
MAYPGIVFPVREKATKNLISIEGIDSPMLDYLDEQNQKSQPVEEVKQPSLAEEQNKVITRFLTLFKPETLSGKVNPKATLSYEEV